MEKHTSENEMKRTVILFILLLLLNFHTSYCRQDSDQEIRDTTEIKKEFKGWDRFSLNLGYFLTGNNSGITLGSRQLGLGIVVDIEDALDLQVTSSVFRGNAEFSFGKTKRHNILVDYFSINRKASKILDADLEIGDQTFPLGTQIDSKYNLSIIRAKYDYSFYRDNRVSLGASFGFFILPVSFSVKADGSSGQAANMVAPLPVLGIRSDFAIAPKLYLSQSAELLYLKIDTFSGSIMDINMALEYKAFKNFGIGAGLNTFKLRIKAEGNDYPYVDFFGDLSMEYSGLKLYLSYYFK